MYNIDNNRICYAKLIDTIEVHYKSKFVGVFEHKAKIVLAFYNENPDRTRGHSEYFIWYTHGGKSYISSGEWLKDLSFNGIMLPSGKIIYSCSGHHYHKQEGYFIDGGFDYIRTNSDKIVPLGIRDGHIVVLDNNSALSNVIT